jgi:hypothetical protein
MSVEKSVRTEFLFLVWAGCVVNTQEPLRDFRKGAMYDHEQMEPSLLGGSENL